MQLGTCIFRNIYVGEIGELQLAGFAGRGKGASTSGGERVSSEQYCT